MVVAISNILVLTSHAQSSYLIVIGFYSTAAVKVKEKYMGG